MKLTTWYLRTVVGALPCTGRSDVAGPRFIVHVPVPQPCGEAAGTLSPQKTGDNTASHQGDDSLQFRAGRDLHNVERSSRMASSHLLCPLSPNCSSRSQRTSGHSSAAPASASDPRRCRHCTGLGGPCVRRSLGFGGPSTVIRCSRIDPQRTSMSFLGVLITKLVEVVAN